VDVSFKKPQSEAKKETEEKCHRKINKNINKISINYKCTFITHIMSTSSRTDTPFRQE